MSEMIFPLENAAWPVLMVEGSGMIRRSNAAAVAVFGAMLESNSALLSSIWSAENETTADIFLTRSERALTPMLPLKFKTKDGGVSVFSTYVSGWNREGQKFFILQFFGANPIPSVGSGNTVFLGKSAATKPEAQPLEPSVVLKQKLDCALQLTRTVALDFNNALTSILGHTSLLLSKLEHEHPWRNSLVEIEKSAAKAAEVAHDLAAFSLQEKDSSTHIAGNLNQLLRRTVELFQVPSNGQISWRMELHSRLYTTNFDEAKMQQAFVKILENAVQSIHLTGEISVRTRNQDVVAPFQDEAARLVPGHYVRVEFSDTGCGIPTEILSRVFEPFFTTKKSPQHRGLGLAWVYGIVTNHGGSVAISSHVGQGTTVRVYLPAVQKFIKDVTLDDANLGGTQTILMIDDEDLMLTMGETVLSSYGYRVLTANSGVKGLEIFSKAADQIDLVITDLVMPKMSGRELIEHLRRLSPRVKVICSSGYVRAVNSPEEERYLQKPFTSQDLLRKVKEALTEA